MLEIGKPCIRETEQFKTHTDDLITLSQFRGKVVLLCFFDIIRGWDWFKEFVRIPDEINSRKNIPREDFQCIFVLHNYGDLGKEKINKVPYSGPVTASWINTKFELFGIDPENIIIIPNEQWQGSIASDYEYGFFKDNDPHFHGNTGEIFYSYILTDALFVADKWSIRTTDNNERVSFNVITPTNEEHKITGINEVDGTITDTSTNPEARPVIFYSQLLHNTKFFIFERIQNLLKPPYILSVNPEPGSGIHSLDEVKIVFSKPVIDTAANNIINYYVEGGSKGSLELLSVDHTNRNIIENTVRLKFQGNTTANNYDNEIRIFINRAHVTDLSGRLFEEGDNVIRYYSDIEYPEVMLHPEFSKILLNSANVDDLKSVVVRYSKPVVGALNPDFYSFSVPGIEPYYIVQMENNEFLLNFKVTDTSFLKNGETIILTLDKNNITDEMKHGLSNNELEVLVYDGNLYINLNPNITYVIGPGFTDKPTKLLLEYSEPVTGADDVANYSFSNDNIVIDSINKINETEYELLIKIKEPFELIGETQAILTVSEEHIKNSVGQNVQNSSIKYDIDCNPVEFDLDKNAPGFTLGSKAKDHINKFTLRFNKPVIGAETITNYSFSHELVTLTGIEKINESVYLLNIFVADNFPTYLDREVILELNNDDITDRVGNKLKKNDILNTLFL